MFTTLTEGGAEATLDALALGASDFVGKPSNQNMAAISEAIHRDLVPKTKALCHFSLRAQDTVADFSRPVAPPPRPEIRLHASPLRSARPKIVAIGVSTGGPDTLARLLPLSPPVSPCRWSSRSTCRPFSRCSWPSVLQPSAPMPMRECQPGDLPGPSCVWIAPGDNRMVVQQDEKRIRMSTHQGPRENFCRPPVDVIFRSVAAVYGANALGVILTGMGQDGLKGCEALCGAGASVIVQDEASSIVWGNPCIVARAGLAEKIVPLDQIGIETIRRAKVQPSLQFIYAN